MPNVTSGHEASTKKSPWVWRLVSLVGAVAIALLGVEAALHAVGFSFRTFPTVQFGYPNPVDIRMDFVPDRDVFWVSRGYDDVLAAARQSHPSIVFMGDSCTQLGNYPALTLTELAERAPSVTGIKVGVAGWTSEQGLAQLKRDVLPLSPRVITIYYGWNDHWVALGPPDTDARPSSATWWLSQHSRIWQLFQRVRRAAPGRLDQRPNRVDVARYESNLETMVTLAERAASKVVLITAPSGHERGREPPYLASRWLRHLSDLMTQHQLYVAATRTAAHNTNATLCDAEAAFHTDPQRTRYFRDDGIHLTEAGDQAMAHLLSACISRALDEDRDARR
jgi:lysophospholipase L1-like esterase